MHHQTSTNPKESFSTNLPLGKFSMYLYKMELYWSFDGKLFSLWMLIFFFKMKNTILYENIIDITKWVNSKTRHKQQESK